jgi:predicted aspartyl protease
MNKNPLRFLLPAALALGPVMLGGCGSSEPPHSISYGFAHLPPANSPLATHSGDDVPIDLNVPRRSNQDVRTPEPRPGGRPEIALHKNGGAFAVPVSINDAITLDFTIDSGADDVSIPADVVMTLMRTGTINRSDFLGSRTYVLADGSTSPSTIFRIRSLRVGNREVTNVTASMAPTKGGLLLGQSFLRRFGSWSIDNRRSVLVLD